VRKLFKGGNYSRAETIRGNTVTIFLKVVDYARRKNSTVEEVEKWLQVNLAYQN
jgi:hypothetical protein